MKNRFGNWSDVRAFLAVMRAGSTLAASRAMGLSQPTVARRLDALEHTLGVTLFERDTRGARPTAEARALLPAAEALERAAEALAKEAARHHPKAARTIRITAPTMSFSPRFAALLSEFSDQHPNVSFELIGTTDIVDVAAGEADVALRFASRITDDRLICTKLTDVRGAIFTSRRYAERNGVPSGEDDLAGHRFVVATLERLSFTLNTWLQERIAPEQIVSRCSDVDSILAAIMAGQGCGPIPLSVADDHPDLVRCFEPPGSVYVSSWLVIGPDAWRRAEVKAFAAFFAPRFRALFRKFATA